ncbi:MAG: hypothetical protein ACREBD_26190 [Blastocatellia bacterium]
MLTLRIPKHSARLFIAAMTIAVAMIVTLPASATIMQYLEIEDLTRLSSDVFHGQVISTNTYWNAERTHIYTSVRVRISESFKGATRRDQFVTVTQPGGEKDGLRMDYAGRPEFAVGESVALFTVRGKNDDFIVVGLKQGKMRVERGEIVRDFSGIMLVERLNGGRNLRPVTPRSTRLTMEELRNRIARAR